MQDVRYYTRNNDNPDSPTYGHVYSLHRWMESATDIILERLDVNAAEWVDNPALYDASGNGGDNNYHEVTAGVATALIRQWGLPKSLMDAPDAGEKAADG